MFIKISRSGYNRHGEQGCHGLFLILFSNEQNEVRAAVRHVRMVQFGHFMMASTRIGQYKVTLSGSYGSDGLPLNPIKSIPATCWTRIGPDDDWYERIYEWRDVPTVNWSTLIPLPPALQHEFWHPTHQGWNNAGSEAKNLTQWALSNLPQLRKAGK